MRADLQSWQEQRAKAQALADSAEAEVQTLAQAKTVVQEAARMTQQQLEVHLSSLVSSALAAVFPDPYEFKVEFVDRRGRVECDLYFARGNMTHLDPMTSSGGGPLDVASLALRMAFWALSRSRPVIILDEPFKFVSTDLHQACAEMLRGLAKQLHLQIIMISHLPGIVEAADRVFKVRSGVVTADVDVA
jgi:DNA repair exonuclease SbcCD ATPase subunit